MDITISNKPAESYELLKIILDFLGKAFWPIVVLVLVGLFKKEVRQMLIKAKKVELPGGFSLETMDENILQAKELSIEVEKERKPELKNFIDNAPVSRETEANKRMIELGLNPSPSGLNLDYYKDIVDIDPRLALIGLRADLEIMLRNLAIGTKIEINGKDSVSKTILTLLEKGAITNKQFQFINTLLRICNAAAHGAPVNKEQALEVLDIGEVLVKDYVAWLYWGFL